MRTEHTAFKNRAKAMVAALLVAAVAALLGVAQEASILFRITTLLLSLIFVFRYARRPWRDYDEGEHIMVFTLIVAAFMIFATVNNITAYLDPASPPVDGDYPGRTLIGLLLYLAITFELWERNRLLTSATQEVDA